MNSLLQKLWIPEDRKIIVCIDSYLDGVFRGRFFDDQLDGQSFDSLCQLLLMMDDMLERTRNPQSYTARRSFSEFLPSAPDSPAGDPKKGILATFSLQILFRQHASWQGVLLWQEKQQTQNFRSVLELIQLMDSALRGPEGKEAV